MCILRYFPRKLPTASSTAQLLRSEEHTSELQSQSNLVCRLLLEKKKHNPALPGSAPSWLLRLADAAGNMACPSSTAPPPTGRRPPDVLAPFAISSYRHALHFYPC